MRRIIRAALVPLTIIVGLTVAMPDAQAVPFPSQYTASMQVFQSVTGGGWTQRCQINFGPSQSENDGNSIEIVNQTDCHGSLTGGKSYYSTLTVHWLVQPGSLAKTFSASSWCINTGTPPNGCVSTNLSNVPWQQVWQHAPYGFFTRLCGFVGFSFSVRAPEVTFVPIDLTMMFGTSVDVADNCNPIN